MNSLSLVVPFPSKVISFPFKAFKITVYNNFTYMFVPLFLFLPKKARTVFALCMFFFISMSSKIPGTQQAFNKCQMSDMQFL